LNPTNTVCEGGDYKPITDKDTCFDAVSDLIQTPGDYKIKVITWGFAPPGCSVAQACNLKTGKNCEKKVYFSTGNGTNNGKLKPVCIDGRGTPRLRVLRNTNGDCKDRDFVKIQWYSECAEIIDEMFDGKVAPPKHSGNRKLPPGCSLHKKCNLETGKNCKAFFSDKANASNKKKKIYRAICTQYVKPDEPTFTFEDADTVNCASGLTITDKDLCQQAYDDVTDLLEFKMTEISTRARPYGCSASANCSTKNCPFFFNKKKTGTNDNKGSRPICLEKPLQN